MDRFRKPLYMTAGCLALLLGAIGVVLPLLPTTPFVILAAFFFSRGSSRIHHWLLQQKTFGPMIQAWEADRVIPYKAKLLSTTMMLTMVSYPLLFRPFALWLKVLVVFTVFYALWYVWRHRSEPVTLTIERAWDQLTLTEDNKRSDNSSALAAAPSQPSREPKSNRDNRLLTQSFFSDRKKPAPLGWKPAHVVMTQTTDHIA